jgi:signal transduction histidine kinase
MAMTPSRIVLLYATFGAAWILFSDRLLALVTNPAVRDVAQSIKGTLFVAVTAGLLFHLMRRQLAERRVLGEEVHAVIESMSDAVMVVDQKRRIVDVNEAAVKLFAAPDRGSLLVGVDAFLGRAQLRCPDGRPIPFEQTATHRALAGEAVAEYEAHMRRLDGGEIFVGVSSAPVRAEADGLPRLAITIVRDLSEVARFEDAREEFISTAAHEFRTPLAVVKAYAQLMGKRGQGDPKALEVVARQIDRMTRMVEQLLDVSRMRVGGAELRRERFDLGALLAETAEALRARVAGRRILVEPTAAAVLADRARVGRVISSLLENAIRFSPRGGDVEAALIRQGAEAVVSVRDHGLGIPRERQARVFERYYRAHSGTPQDYGGLALGLDASREIVARHGGRIWFESDPGQGSVFSFSLPLAPEERA